MTKNSSEEKSGKYELFLYLQVVDILKRKIIRNDFAPEERLPSEEQLGQVLSVDKSIIKKALDKLIEEGYLQRRFDYNIFVASQQKQKSLETKKELVKPRIAVVCCNTNEQRDTIFLFKDVVFMGIEEIIKKEKAELVYCTLYPEEKEIFFGDIAKEKKISGMVIIGRITPPHFEIIKKAGIEFVMVGDVLSESGTIEKADIVGIDDFEKSHIAVKHLLENGHRDIVFISTYRGYPWDAALLQGYRQALIGAGINPNANLEIKLESTELGKTIEEAYDKMKIFLQKKVPFTGIFCNGDDYIKGVLKALKEANLKIPEDVSIIAADPQGVTFVELVIQDLGRKAVERLFFKIRNPGAAPIRTNIPIKLSDKGTVRKIN